jgi:hypothetical protein
MYGTALAGSTGPNVDWLYVVMMVSRQLVWLLIWQSHDGTLKGTVALLPPLKQRPPSPTSRDAVVLFNFSIQNPKSKICATGILRNDNIPT